MAKPQTQILRCITVMLGLMASTKAFQLECLKERSIGKSQGGNERTRTTANRHPHYLSNDDENPVFEKISDDEEEGISKEEILVVVADNLPSQWTIMKEVLGLNIFTLILAVIISFFMGSNIILGPGWLGSRLGIADTVNEIAGSLPEVIDLSQPDYLL